ncbi:MAG: ribose-phosphate pyrophosphokinase [Alphaproteobacteria bacterium]|nr:MAG: ribose-phosphate pyrophosphokinase [Caulobacteraceae bacterium]TPW04646.1 MAG: ribose-phosphate pyrophosphokinase [Alphaproteobacteria bacterium]
MSDVSVHAFHDDILQAQAFADALGVAPLFVDTHVFDDGEIVPRTPAAARTVVVYRSLAQPNAKLVELLLACDAWRRAGVERLVLVAPYLCYMRQDAVFSPGEPLSQQVIGRLLGERFERIVTVDAHLHRTPRLEDVFPGVDCDNLRGADAIAAHLRAETLPENLLVLGPDVESAPWVEGLAHRIGREGAVLSKTRHGDHEVSIALPEDAAIAGRPVLLLDDICTSGGTLATATRELRARGATTVDAIVTHALFSPDAGARLAAAGLRSIRSCDSCPHPTNAISLAALLADAVRKEWTS